MGMLSVLRTENRVGREERRMTKAEWLKVHDMYMSHVKGDEEADEEWIRSMELLSEKFDEIYEDDDE